MTLPIVFMYSGQGSQYYHMGRSFFDENPVFRNQMLKGDRVFQEMTGFSLIQQLYNDAIDKIQPMTQTLLTHPAIFMLECALTQVLLDKNIIPNSVLGTSLGEFAAAVSAGMISFEAGLTAVIQQAQFMSACPAGSMLAIIHDPDIYHTQAYLHEHSELAAVNFDAHFVVAGTTEALNAIVKKLNEYSISSLMLPVTQAFHSKLINGAQAPFLQALESMQINKPTLPYISCASGGLLSSITPAHFWNIAKQPILFQQTIQALEHQNPAIYIDLGPSGTLATFVKYNLSVHSSSSQHTILAPFGNDNKNLEKLIQFLNGYTER